MSFGGKILKGREKRENVTKKEKTQQMKDKL
jgi:hypothetical protein